jgi:antitoxin (DNA-binding transcriptional repressor) of toxin-antitoxin stability system
MKQVTIHEAKTHLSRLIQLALQGEEIVIAKGSVPLITLQVLPQLRKRKAGGAKGILVSMPANFNKPLSDFHEYTEP